MPIQNGMRTHGQQRRANKPRRVRKSNVRESGNKVFRS